MSAPFAHDERADDEPGRDVARAPRRDRYPRIDVDDAVRDLIMRRATAGQIKKQALAGGMRTLRQDGWEKVVKGITTPAEVLETTLGDEPEDLESESGEAAVASVRPEFVNDRRQFVRVDRSVTVRYKVLRVPPAPAPLEELDEEEALTRNISAGGLCFVAAERFVPGSILDMSIELVEGQKPIECLAKVLRQQAVKDKERGEHFETSVCFLDLSSAGRQKLQKFVGKEAS